ncbi:C45 family autoproteolytic acyltransferase/hydolase [Enterococcus ureasiticus]|uniref:Peptidase C45 n=1 Tax=Enterococcus ureasiticus TaxID=903984 RepID=A0A1E5GMU7_9ENTE|nr:C45 family peptidase [Enterococcus ureasiticus]OEG14022.1 peptidase C45 [Enterococcus ureasiticus]
MRETKQYLKNFVGTNYEIGQKIGEWVKSDSKLIKQVLLPPDSYPKDKYQKIKTLLEEFCPGINDEIKGFSDTLTIEPHQVLFYAMTYLERGCSLMALLPSKTEDGHTLLARNYDFSDEMEEMCFAYTDIKGKYNYIGSTLNLFGRSDGMNECGLSVCKASNGLPVGNFEGGQKAGVTGFSFWIVVRSILENCKNIEEAIELVMQMPIAYNLSLMLADKSGKIAIMQCIDGHKEYKIADENIEEGFLSCTNHALLEKIKPYEKILIENSVIRNNHIIQTFSNEQIISENKIKELLSTPYPDGLCCHYYKDFFGTLRGAIFNTTKESVQVAFGAPDVNKWHTFKVEPLKERSIKVSLLDKKAPREFYRTI